MWRFFERFLKLIGAQDTSAVQMRNFRLRQLNPIQVSLLESELLLKRLHYRVHKELAGGEVFLQATNEVGMLPSLQYRLPIHQDTKGRQRDTP